MHYREYLRSKRMSLNEIAGESVDSVAVRLQKNYVLIRPFVYSVIRLQQNFPGQKLLKVSPTG